MEELDFVIDTTASEDNEVLKAFKNPFPVFSNTKFTLGDEKEAKDTDKSVDDETYFEEHFPGEFICSQKQAFFEYLKYSGLPPPTIRIKDALERCPIKVFKKVSSTDGSKNEWKFNDKLLNALDDYLGELRPKKYSFVTDGIETKKDISHLGMSNNQLKKMNRVSKLY